MITVKGYTKISKSAKNIEGQAINELEVDGYKVWTGMPRRKRPVWLGSLKTPEQAKKEKEFEDEVMRETDTIWDYIGDNVHYAVMEKSKQVQVKPYQRKGKYVMGHRRVDPRDLVTVYHGTSKKNLESIKKDKKLKATFPLFNEKTGEWEKIVWPTKDRKEAKYWAGHHKDPKVLRVKVKKNKLIPSGMGEGEYSHVGDIRIGEPFRLRKG